MLAVYGIVAASRSVGPRPDPRDAAAAAVLLALFLVLEARRRAAGAAGSVPPGSLAAANIVGVLWAAAMFAWFFLSALYMQLVLGYSPLQVGLAFLPANLIMRASRWASPRSS